MLASKKQNLEGEYINVVNKHRNSRTSPFSLNSRNFMNSRNLENISKFKERILLIERKKYLKISQNISKFLEIREYLEFQEFFV
jgi:hypothetical protein